MRALSLIIAASAVVVSTHAATLKDTIVNMNKKVCACLVKGDAKAFEKLTRAGVTKNFVYSEDGKNMTYDEMLKGVKLSMTMGKITSADARLVKLEIKGNTAHATSTHTMKIVTKGQDKKSHVSVISGKSVDTYVKVGDTWKMSKMAWSDTKMTMDGKPIGASKP